MKIAFFSHYKSVVLAKKKSEDIQNVIRKRKKSQFYPPAIITINIWVYIHPNFFQMCVCVCETYIYTIYYILFFYIFDYYLSSTFLSQIFKHHEGRDCVCLIH